MFFQSNFECLDGSWCLLVMLVFVAANGVSQIIFINLMYFFLVEADKVHPEPNFS